MKVLVLGGTGAMGVYLLPELIKDGHEVFVTSRSKQINNKLNVTWIIGNAKNLEFVEHILVHNRFDVIVDFMVYNTLEFERHRDLFLDSTEQYLFLSTYRVFSNSKFPIIENSSRLLEISNDNEYLSTDEYALTKARQENYLRESNRKNWTIVRPSITYSKNRLQLGVFEADITMFRSAQNLPIVLPKEILDRQTTMSWAGDVAKMIAKLIGNPQALGEDFNVVTGEHVSWKNVAEIYTKYTDLKYENVSLEKFLEIPGINKYQVLYDRAFDRIMDNSKILKVANMKQTTLKKLEDGLREEIMTFKSFPEYTMVNYAMNGRIDRLTKSHMSLKGVSLKNRLKYYQAYIRR